LLVAWAAMPGRRRALTVLVGAVCGAADPASLPGHLKPLGEQHPTNGHIKTWEAPWPTPEEFFEISTKDKGYGEPILFKGLAKAMPAYDLWATDEQLLQRHGKEKVAGVEYDLKETRAGGQAEHIKNLGQFLKEYNKSDIYMVSSPISAKMQADVSYPEFMSCGGYLNYLDANTLWVGRGSSKSVVHYDDQDNLNCMVAGRKRFMIYHPKWKKQFEAHPNSPKNGFGWVDTDLDKKVKGYGAFMKLDVDSIDLTKTPRWSEVDWWYADLEPGDCLYLPFQWYHQVTAHAGRTINVHTWYWRPKKFDKKSCETARNNGELPKYHYNECTFGYEPPSGHLGVKKGKTTKCQKKKRPSSEL